MKCELACWQAGVGGSCPRVVWAPVEYGDVVASSSVEGGIRVWEEVVADGESTTFHFTQLSFLFIVFASG